MQKLRVFKVRMIRRDMISTRFVQCCRDTAMCVALLCVLLCITGCGGGSSSSSSTSFEVYNVAVKIAQENSGETDGIFASARGSGITGGWLETANSVKITGSDLVMENVTGAYETFMARASGGYPSGEYSLAYLDGGETKRLVKSLDWTIIPKFPSSPTLSWDSSSKFLTVNFSSLPSGSAKYLLRLYNSDTGSLRRETYETVGNEIREYVSQAGNYKVLLIGNVYESDALKSKAVYIFQNITLD